MKKFLAVLLFFGVLSGSVLAQLIREIPDKRYLGISKVGVNDGIIVVTYNPVLCRAFGKLVCNFFKLHERGHIVLRHLDREEGTLNAEERMIEEEEADCYAARHLSDEEAEAVIRFFDLGFGSSNIHGSFKERAERVRQCSRWGSS